AARHRAELQILLDRDLQEGAATLRHMGDAETHDVLGRPTRDLPAFEGDVASGVHHAAQRAQHRRLAGAVGAEQGPDMALREAEADAVKRLVLAVEGIKAPDLKHRASLASLSGREGGFRAGAEIGADHRLVLL